MDAQIKTIFDQDQKNSVKVKVQALNFTAQAFYLALTVNSGL